MRRRVLQTLVQGTVFATAAGGRVLAPAHAAGSSRPSYRGEALQRLLDGMAAPIQKLGLGMEGGKAVGGHVFQGKRPHQDATPDWWSPDNTDPRWAGWWHWMEPWFHIFKTVDTRLGNWTVELRRHRLLIQRASTRAWTELYMRDEAGGHYYSDQGKQPGGEATVYPAREGGQKWLMHPDHVEIHGYPGGAQLQDWQDDIANVAYGVQSRLGLMSPSGTDDRERAQVVIFVGIDYKPREGFSHSRFASGFFPASGGTAAVLVQPQWTEHFYFPYAGARVVDRTVSGLPPSAYTVDEAWFRAHPPPLPAA